MSVELYSVHQVYKSNHFSLQGKICEEKKKKRWSLLSVHTVNIVAWHKNRPKNPKKVNITTKIISYFCGLIYSDLTVAISFLSSHIPDPK